MCGAEVTKRTMDGTMQLSAEDLMGWSKARDLQQEKGRHPFGLLSSDYIPHVAIIDTFNCFHGMHQGFLYINLCRLLSILHPPQVLLWQQAQ